MRILQTITDLNLSSGGAPVATYNLFNGLRAAGVETSLLTLLPFSEKDKFNADKNKVIAYKYDGISQFVYSRNLKGYLNSHRDYDLYHANGIWTYPTYKTIKTACKYSKPCIVTIHGMLNKNALSFSSFKKKVFLNLFQRKELNDIRCIHATSRYEAECIRLAGINTPIAVIPNGIVHIKQEEKSTGNTIKRFGFVGRIDRVKNIHTLLAAWNSLGDKTKYCQLSIIGGGDKQYLKELHNFVASANIKNVFFEGTLSYEATQRELSGLDYLIIPSVSENFGMVVPEALIKGVPVIATKGTPWRDLEENQCGWWIEPSIDSIADAIESAINISERERKNMGEKGKQLVNRKYTIDITVKNMIELYNWILTNSNKPNFVIL